MHLRHIDPGSSEWMDAMLEGEEQPVQGGTHRGRKPESEAQSAAPSSIASPIGANGGRREIGTGLRAEMPRR